MKHSRTQHKMIIIKAKCNFWHFIELDYTLYYDSMENISGTRIHRDFVMVQIEPARQRIRWDAAQSVQEQWPIWCVMNCAKWTQAQLSVMQIANKWLRTPVGAFTLDVGWPRITWSATKTPKTHKLSRLLERICVRCATLATSFLKYRMVKLWIWP